MEIKNNNTMIQEKSANKILFDTILNYEHEMK
jgi:hypothetical protein